MAGSIQREVKKGAGYEKVVHYHACSRIAPDTDGVQCSGSAGHKDVSAGISASGS
jgi:hypothetical protein